MVSTNINMSNGEFPAKHKGIKTTSVQSNSVQNSNDNNNLSKEFEENDLSKDTTKETNVRRNLSNELGHNNSVINDLPNVPERNAASVHKDLSIDEVNNNRVLNDVSTESESNNSMRKGLSREHVDKDYVRVDPGNNVNVRKELSDETELGAVYIEGDRDSGCSGGSANNSTEPEVEIPCTPCFLDDEPRKVESVAYCLECKEHLCLSCRKQHRRFRPTRRHHLLENGQEEGTDSIESPETENCPEHFGKNIDYYCELHQLPCCKSCVDINHNHCEAAVKYIPDECKNVKECGEINANKERIVAVIAKVQEVIKKKNRHIDRCKFQEETAISRVTALTNIATGMITKLAEEAKAEIRDARTHLSSKLTKEIDTCETAYNALKGTEHKLISVVRSGNEPQIFITMKEASKQIKNYSEFVDEAEKNIRDDDIHFKTDKRFEAMLQNVTSMGSVYVDDTTSMTSMSSASTSTSSIQNQLSPTLSKRRKAIPIGGHSVRLRGDRTTCYINGCKFLRDGRIVCADYNNKCIKMFEGNFKLVNHVRLTSRPTDLTIVGENEVATSLIDELQIQLVIIGKDLCLGRLIPTRVRYTGLAYSAEHVLYASYAVKDGTGQIDVLDMTGNIIRTIDNIYKDKVVMVRPTAIHVDDERSVIYVTDVGQNCVLCFDANPGLTKNEQPLFVYSEKSLELRNGITADDEGYIYVSSGNRSIHQISVTGHKVYEILTSADGIGLPHCLTFFAKNQFLLVSEFKENSVKLFKLS